MKAKAKISKPYKFMVLDSKNNWSAWTGFFETKLTAMEWFNKHGQFHLDNNHILGLFNGKSLLEKFMPKDI